MEGLSLYEYDQKRSVWFVSSQLTIRFRNEGYLELQYRQGVHVSMHKG